MTINLAVVGLGKMGLSHLAIANALPEFRVVALCDSAPMVGGIIERYGHLRHLPGYDKVLEQTELDALIIATPTARHGAMVKAALDRGLHVFCEKPLSLTAETSRSLAETAANRGMVTQVGYHNRFVATFAEAKRLIASGALGNVSHVTAEAYGPVVLRPSKSSWRAKPAQGGGCLYDYAAHPLNLLNWYFGVPNRCTSATLKSLFSSEVDDEVYAALDFPDGVSAQLSVNWSDASERRMSTRISIWGTGGKISVERQEIQVFLSGNTPIPDGYSQGWNVRFTTDLTKPVSFYLRGEEYTAQLESFARSIKINAAAQNDFGAAAETDATIEMIRDASAIADAPPIKRLMPAPPAAGGLLGRILSR